MDECTGGKELNEACACECPAGKVECGGNCVDECPPFSARIAGSCDCVWECSDRQVGCGGNCVDECTGVKVLDGSCACVCPDGYEDDGTQCVTVMFYCQP